MYSRKVVKKLIIFFILFAITTQSTLAFSFNIFKKKQKEKEKTEQIITPEEKEKGKKTLSVDECVDYAITTTQ